MKRNLLLIVGIIVAIFVLLYTSVFGSVLSAGASTKTESTINWKTPELKDELGAGLLRKSIWTLCTP